MPEKGAKIKELKNCSEKIHKIDLQYRFCSYFHRFCMFGLQFNMKDHAMNTVFHLLLANLQKRKIKYIFAAK